LSQTEEIPVFFFFDERRMMVGWTVNVEGPSWMLFVLHHEFLVRLEMLVTVKAF
jgi:hypothetical protein